MKKLEKLGDRVKHMRLKRGLTQLALAEKIGAQQQAIQQIEANKVKFSVHLLALAKELNVSAEWLQSGSKVAFDDPPPFYGTAGIPHSDVLVLEWSEVKEWCKNNAFPFKAERQFVPYYFKGRSNVYALCIQNDSMVSIRANTKSFHPGGILLVDPDLQPKNNDYVVVQFANTHEATFRQYVRDAGTVYLKPLNSQYPTAKKEKGTKLFGVVVAYLDVLIPE